MSSRRSVSFAILLAVLIPMSAPSVLHASQAAPAAPAAASAAAALAGSWRSSPDITELTTPLQQSVWGSGATSVRVTEVTIQPSGAGTLKVTTRIEDAKKKTVPKSTTIDQVQFQLGDASPGLSPVRTEYSTTVSRAERSYPDDATATWPIEGARVLLATVQGEANTLEVRLESADGQAAFFAITSRAGRSPTRRSVR